MVHPARHETQGSPYQILGISVNFNFFPITFFSVPWGILLWITLLVQWLNILSRHLMICEKNAAGPSFWVITLPSYLADASVYILNGLLWMGYAKNTCLEISLFISSNAFWFAKVPCIFYILFSLFCICRTPWLGPWVGWWGTNTFARCHSSTGQYLRNFKSLVRSFVALELVWLLSSLVGV